MADKKITGLNERLVPIIGEDLILLVANVVPASLAANYKVQVKNFLSNCQIALPATEASALRVTANVIANSVAVQTAAEFRLDAGNNAIGGTKAYGAIINHTIANTLWSRAVSPVAYLGIAENAGAAGNTTTFLLDVGLGGTANASANLSGANADVVLSKTADKVATHAIKILYNNVTYWLLASNTAPA